MGQGEHGACPLIVGQFRLFSHLKFRIRYFSLVRQILERNDFKFMWKCCLFSKLFQFVFQDTVMKVDIVFADLNLNKVGEWRL